MKKKQWLGENVSRVHSYHGQKEQECLRVF